MTLFYSNWYFGCVPLHWQIFVLFRFRTTKTKPLIHFISTDSAITGHKWIDVTNFVRYERNLLKHNVHHIFWDAFPFHFWVIIKVSTERWTICLFKYFEILLISRNFVLWVEIVRIFLAYKWTVSQRKFTIESIELYSTIRFHFEVFLVFWANRLHQISCENSFVHTKYICHGAYTEGYKRYRASLIVKLKLREK